MRYSQYPAHTAVPRCFYVLLFCFGITAPAASTENKPDAVNNINNNDNVLLMPYYEMHTQKSFEEVVEDADFAITEYNFRLLSHLKIGSGLIARGYNNAQPLDILLFCNLEYARELLEIFTHYHYYCPYRVIIRQSIDGVSAGVALLPPGEGNNNNDIQVKKINQQLRNIVDYATSIELFDILENESSAASTQENIH